MKKNGIKLIIASFVLIIISVLPLSLYIIFGPKDGNPIGLGLLAFFGSGIGEIILCSGITILAIDFFKNKKNN